MYMVNRGPRHPLRNLNRRTQRINDIAPAHNHTDSTEENGVPGNVNSISEMSSPKPVFHSKKTFSRSNSNTTMTQESPSNSQTDDAARYLADAWYRTQHDYEMCMKLGREKGPIVYQEKVHTLQGFEPFDLEQWMAKRTFEKYKQ